MRVKRRSLELLAPARDAATACQAIVHGADAVYIGAPRFGARAQAGNTVDDIRRVADFAHNFDARVYATVNTLVYDDELRDVEHLITELYHADVDALIVQDLGILRLDIPPIALHASTQCDLRTPEKARFLESLGFSQLVLARELSRDEIKVVAEAVTVPLEAFVHGALCVSYSGRCQASCALKRRSANRGECAQLCRLPYDLIDGDGNVIMHDKHLLSLRDFNQSDRLTQLIDGGVTSFKIEGRLKDMAYVKNVVAYYRQALDRIISRRDDLVRSSTGTSEFSFTPRLEKSFNRGFTHYFFDGLRPANGVSMASIHSPKSQGEPIGTVRRSSGNRLEINTHQTLVNGDGLTYIGDDGLPAGVRVNRAEGNVAFLQSPVHLAVGTQLYRTFDKAHTDILAHTSATRRIALDARLWKSDSALCLTLADDRGCKVTHTVVVAELQRAVSDQSERQRAEIAKLGNTVYCLRNCEVIGGWFVPSSVLSQLRRETVDLLDRTRRIARRRNYRRPEDLAAPCFASVLYTADNIANRLARQVVEQHGATVAEPALETSPVLLKNGMTLMHTRYCLRRELGACLRDKNARRLPAKLYLRSGNITLEVDCDCKTCEMHLRF